MRSVLLSVLLITVCGCRPETAAKPAKLRIFCGSSMSTPIQEIGKLFAEKEKVEIEYDFGGSETLMPRVAEGKAADVFVCHDPFEQKVRDVGMWGGCAVVGHMEPVIAVRPGNPKNITSLPDLSRDDVSLGIGIPQYSTCGEMFVAWLDQQGVKDKVMRRVTVQMRTHSELANGLIAGPLDAVVIWNSAAALYKDKLELAKIEAQYQPIRVTVVGLSQSENPALRDKFLDFCRSYAVQAVFRSHGYTRGGK